MNSNTSDLKVANQGGEASVSIPLAKVKNMDLYDVSVELYALKAIKSFLTTINLYKIGRRAKACWKFS